MARAELPDSLTLPTVGPRAVPGLKFSAALPPRIATTTLADFEGRPRRGPRARMDEIGHLNNPAHRRF
ncbi:hypothetical protein, partial [Streptomyces sp. NRRL F-5630]|uniref:hypothetical protein n=1 Tax=Streptomyces sp. NRRL F-5630 TaxID=1463864 RepID=UPI003EB6B123